MIAFEDRADENIRGAEILLLNAAPCPHASATRSYFAAYQRCVAKLDDIGETPPRRRDGKQYWVHDGFDIVVEDRLKMGDDAADLKHLFSLRIRADYYPDCVTVDEAEKALEIAREFIASLCGRWR